MLSHAGDEERAGGGGNLIVGEVNFEVFWCNAHQGASGVNGRIGVRHHHYAGDCPFYVP
jgi:hypothetical protein